MRSLSCCCKTSFSCLAEKISFPESNLTGAAEGHYQRGTETSGALGVWDAQGCCGPEPVSPWQPCRRGSHHGSARLLLRLRYGQRWTRRGAFPGQMLSRVRQERWAASFSKRKAVWKICGLLVYVGSGTELCPGQFWLTNRSVALKRFLKERFLC